MTDLNAVNDKANGYFLLNNAIIKKYFLEATLQRPDDSTLVEKNSQTKMNIRKMERIIKKPQPKRREIICSTRRLVESLSTGHPVAEK